MSEEHAAVLTKPGSRVTIPVVARTLVTSIPSEPWVADFTGRSSWLPSPYCRATLPLPDDASGIRIPFLLFTGRAQVERPGSPTAAPPRWGPEVLYPYANSPPAQGKPREHRTVVTVVSPERPVEPRGGVPGKKRTFITGDTDRQNSLPNGCPCSSERHFEGTGETGAAARRGKM